jgi:hypothetical protein
MSTANLQFYPSVIITAPTTIDNNTITDTSLQIVGPYDITSVSATIDGIPVTLTCQDNQTNGAGGPNGTSDLTDTDPDITCTVDGGIPNGGVLAVTATDSLGSPAVTTTQSYVNDIVNPVITPSTPTVISQNTITDSSFVITDANGISIVSFTGVANTLVCTPLVPTLTSSTTCTGSISASGTLTINVTDTA